MSKTRFLCGNWTDGGSSFFFPLPFVLTTFSQRAANLPLSRPNGGGGGGRSDVSYRISLLSKSLKRETVNIVLPLQFGQAKPKRKQIFMEGREKICDFPIRLSCTSPMGASGVIDRKPLLANNTRHLEWKIIKRDQRKAAPIPTDLTPSFL